MKKTHKNPRTTSIECPACAGVGSNWPNGPYLDCRTCSYCLGKKRIETRSKRKTNKENNK